MIVNLISRHLGPKHLAGIKLMILPFLVWVCVFVACVSSLSAEEKTETPAEAIVQAESAKPAEEAKAVEVVNPAEEAKSAQEAKTTEAVLPAEEAKPAEVVNPAEEAKPVEDANLVGGALPAEAVISSETAKPAEDQPLIINADNIEYSGVANEVIATGNVVVDNKGSKLSCARMTVNTLTKDAQAEGDGKIKARLEDSQGIKEGTKIIYNFETKSGTIIDAEFRSNPYFGKASAIEKPNEQEFIIKKGFISTCNYTRPHWRMGMEKVNFYPQNKIDIEGATFYLGQVPAMYIPNYSHTLRDPLMKVQLNPGHSKDWGYYMESIYRTQFNDHLVGRLLLDYRQKTGSAEGYGFNYQHENFGKGDLKYWYTEERVKKYFESDQTTANEFQRYLLRWRHKWIIDKNTDFTAEMIKLMDSKRKKAGLEYDVLKDYFFREFEKDSEPLTYFLLHHNFSYSTLDFYAQKRLNHWYEQQDKLPEIRYSMPSLQLGNTPLYLDNSSLFTNYSKKEPAGTYTDSDISMTRFDSITRLSMPRKVFFVEFTPFVKSQETYYNKDNFGDTNLVRTIFFSGADMSTKFYRLFNVKTNALGLDINQLRHIITPIVGYTYQNSPTISSSKLKQFDSIDTIGFSGSTALLGIYNKLQTKRNGASVDLVDFRVDNTYNFRTKTTPGSLSDFLFHIRVLPYSWMTFESDATYKHSGDSNDPNYGKFTDVNYNLSLAFGEERSFGLGQRYARGLGNEMTYELIWRLNPKWKFSVYQRRQFANVTGIKSGLREQEYVLSRDFHCWQSDFTWNIKRGQGESIWLVFRLKAFPELEFDYNQAYHQPKPGSQSEQNY
ncbi:MAG: hypothetical protein Q8O22_06470 [Candidatus Omnitrophota bacterium]|nr:hypothetical protein [Candidatus Omnitrophota bacterium]